MQGWIAELSNGETYHETPPDELGSSWQRLLRHIDEAGISITRLSVVRGNVQVYAMPHKMCDGYFQAYEARAKWLEKLVTTSQGVGSVVGDQVFITWVDMDGLKVNQEVRPLDSCKAHTTIQ